MRKLVNSSEGEMVNSSEGIIWFLIGDKMDG